MVRVCVEAAFGHTLTDAATTGGVWTDITRFVHLPSGVTINRGAQDELEETQPGTLSLRLSNADGRFTPTNAGSPYYPHVKKNVPIRVSVVTAGSRNLVRNPSFEGGGEQGNLADWTWPTGVEVITVATPVWSGTRSARVTWPASAAAYFATRVYGLTVGAVYTASVNVRVPTGSTPVRLSMGGTTSAATTTTGAYTLLTTTFTATDAVMDLHVVPAAPPSAGHQVFVDAVQVEAGTVRTGLTTNAARLHWRFWGLVNQWPVKWSGLYSTVQITATDVFKILSHTEALQPMVIEEMLRWEPYACYPLAEEEGATSAGDVCGLMLPQNMRVMTRGSGGALEFGAGLAPLGVERAPLFTPASATAGKYLRADLGPEFADASSREFLLAECWFATTTPGRTILTLHSTDTSYYLAFYLQADTGYLAVESRADDVYVSTVVPGLTNLADGRPHHLVYDEGNQEVLVDGATLGGWADIWFMFNIRRITLGASHTGGGLWDGTISCVGLYADGSLYGADLAEHYWAGTTGYAGETAETRGLRLAQYADIPYSTEGHFPGGLAEQAALGRTPLDHLREVETTESGKLFARRDSPGVVLQSRTVRYNPTASVTLDYADLETDEVELADDDQKMVNTAVVSRPGGATMRMVNVASRREHGPYERPVEVLRTTDVEAADLGAWLLSRYADPPPELRQITVEASTLPLAVYRALLEADISTVATVTGMPEQAPAATMTVTVEGYTETIGQAQHHIAFHTSRTDTDAVWALDDAVYSVLGATTRLAY